MSYSPSDACSVPVVLVPEEIFGFSGAGPGESVSPIRSASRPIAPGKDSLTGTGPLIKARKTGWPVPPTEAPALCSERRKPAENTEKGRHPWRNAAPAGLVARSPRVPEIRPRTP